MFSRLFGQFLLQEGIITPKTLSAALGRLGEVRPLLGILALAHGYMTPDQVEDVNEAQKREDKRFGQIAIEKGYLVANDLEVLLSAQKNEHVLLGQILVEEGALSHEGFLKALESYREKSGLSSEGYEAVKGNDADRAVASVLAGQPGGEYPLVKSWAALFVRNVIRFIDPGVAIDPFAEKKTAGLRTFFQSMKGDREITVFLSAEEPVFLDLARRFSKFETDGFDDMAEASVGEFLNVCNGLFTVNCSDKGVELDLLPPEQATENNLRLLDRPDALLPLLLPEGILWAGIYC